VRAFFARAQARPSHIDARVKVIALLVVSVLLVVLERPLPLASLAVATFVTLLATRPPLRALLLVLALIALGVWGTMLGQAIFYAEFPRTAIVTLVRPDAPVLGPLTGGIALYREGFFHGALQSLRLVAALCLGLGIVWTTDARELVRALVRLRVPYGIAFMTVTAIRFLPVVLDEAATIVTVRRLRGLPLWTSPFAAVRPLFFTNIRRATVLADSIESRAFSAAVAARTGDDARERLRPHDRVLLLAVLLVLALVLAIKLLFVLYRLDLFYQPSLRWLYALAREHL
jgi:energy-coupling factor transport system permease protein